MVDEHETALASLDKKMSSPGLSEALASWKVALVLLLAHSLVFCVALVVGTAFGLVGNVLAYQTIMLFGFSALGLGVLEYAFMTWHRRLKGIGP